MAKPEVAGKASGKKADKKPGLVKRTGRFFKDLKSEYKKIVSVSYTHLFRTFCNGPGTNLLHPGSQVGNQSEKRIALGDNTVKAGLCQVQLFEEH